NEQKLLDGSFSNKGLQVGAESGQHIGITIKNMNTNELIASAVKNQVKFGVSNTEATDTSSTDKNHYAANTLTNGEATLTAGMLAKFYTVSTDTTKIVDTDVRTWVAANGAKWTQAAATDGDKTSAPTAADFAALNAFAKNAIKDVSKQRSDLGAIQNRLEHTISNLDNIVENTTSAEAAIRDTDVATEMVKYANNNILQQAGTSMLSQANQTNQLALSLLG
ncbi:MAG: flagellin, partial [Lachnospiraceae bacterium]|nr:flagellin [Lachnospiraceae bacterium]